MFEIQDVDTNRSWSVISLYIDQEWMFQKRIPTPIVEFEAKSGTQIGKVLKC